jgi:hypothetical protein
LNLRQGQVGIVLILTLIIVGSRDDFHLKDWQPLMAALIALGGGTLAYRGAMAKVHADQEKEREELKRKRLGLLMRLLFAIARLEKDAQRHRLLMNPSRYEGDINRAIQVRDLRFEGFEELEEAWKNLDLLPRTTIFNIDGIRAVMAQNAAFLDKIPEGEVRDVVFVHSGTALHPCLAHNELIAKSAGAVAMELRREIAMIEDEAEVEREAKT